MNISIIIPIFNEEATIAPLVTRIAQLGVVYEIIVVDDHSNDRSHEVVRQLASTYPITLHTKKGKKGKAQSIIEGAHYAKYDVLCMIDGDLQYPPEAIPSMLAKIQQGADIVVGNRRENPMSFQRKVLTKSYLFFFGKLMHQFDCDVQSGLKVFRKEIIERLDLHPSQWAFDLELLVKARNAGYTIVGESIAFGKRQAGHSKINLFTATFEIGFTALKLKFVRPDIVPFHPNTIKVKGKGFHYKGKEFIHHSDIDHHHSSFHRLSGVQIFLLIILGEVLFFSFYADWHTSIVAVVALLTIIYFSDLLFNLFLIFRSFIKDPEIRISNEEIAARHEWPMYTILCPLYKEAHILPQFLDSMQQLDYPKDKLEIMLLLEEDDTQTLAKAYSFNLPSYVKIVQVPHSLPKTKPKACNVGLAQATGEYLVIYDAEDMPDPLQLKKTVIGFSKADKGTVCLQAKLNFYNPKQNLLTRVFTAEYSLWFDLVLTGLQSIHAPIPLGGTSNHFKTDLLRHLQGWDSFNVTEDCDLGIRLIKQGYKTAIIDSITLEEANSSPGNWFWQRTRWIKGYIQTYFLHMRDISTFSSAWDKPHVVTFQFVIGGKIMSMFINPFMWFVTILYFMYRAQIGTFIESFFPIPVLYMGTISLIFGNFLYMYYYMIGCAKHGHFDLTKYVLLVPLYWLAMSVACWVAWYNFIKNPHHWFKTKHGLHLTNRQFAHTQLHFQ